MRWLKFLFNNPNPEPRTLIDRPKLAELTEEEANKRFEKIYFATQVQPALTRRYRLMRDELQKPIDEALARSRAPEQVIESAIKVLELCLATLRDHHGPKS